MRRCAGRIGLVEPECAKDTEETRVALETLIPQAKAGAFVEGLQLIGVRFCHEQNSDCTNCPLKKTCPESGKTPTTPVKAAKPKAPKKPR
jgi:endonuclease III